MHYNSGIILHPGSNLTTETIHSGVSLYLCVCFPQFPAYPNHALAFQPLLPYLSEKKHQPSLGSMCLSFMCGSAARDLAFNDIAVLPPGVLDGLGSLQEL